ncbi:hypothetical protein EIP86_000898 [Pleurotus ostreatoroseus]|nr:hypothetical protein EIP86_000898 [Pleurotus ostreatoroseus]
MVNQKGSTAANHARGCQNHVRCTEPFVEGPGSERTLEVPATELPAEDAERTDVAVGAELVEEAAAPGENTGVGAALVPELPATGTEEKIKLEEGTFVEAETLAVVCGVREGRGAGGPPDLELLAVAAAAVEELPADGPELTGAAGSPVGSPGFLVCASAAELSAWRSPTISRG